jgi:hypothetical protein
MAWTLAEFSKIETDPLRKSVIDTLLMESNLMQMIPWETTGTLSTTIIKLGQLPSVGFRKINEGYASTDGSFDTASETISLMGCYMDCDKAIARAKNTVADARAITQMMALKGVAYKFNDKFINGDPLTDPEEFKGISKRVDDVNAAGYTEQYIDNAGTSGDGILLSSAESHNFLNKLDQLIYAVRGHKPDVMLMNKKMLLALRSLLRKEGLLDTSRDMFDRIVDRYQGIPLIDVGVKADQTTEIITSTETLEAAGGSESTSIYAVKFGVGEYLWGIQEYPLEVEDKGLLEATPVYRTQLDWPLGLAVADPRSIARLYGIIPDSST